MAFYFSTRRLRIHTSKFISMIAFLYIISILILLQTKSTLIEKRKLGFDIDLYDSKRQRSSSSSRLIGSDTRSTKRLGNHLGIHSITSTNSTTKIVSRHYLTSSITSKTASSNPVVRAIIVKHIFVPNKASFYRRQSKEVNHFRRPLMLHPTNICRNQTTLLLVALVISSCTNKQRRDAIRATWGRSNKFVQVVFVIGTCPNDTLILQESQTNNDIIQYGISDSYDFIVRKTMGGLQWSTQFCASAKYVMKTDDDMFFHIQKLVDVIGGFKQTSRVVTGRCGRGSIVYRKGKWKLTPEQYPFPRLPMYCIGAAYVISNDAVRMIVDTARYVPMVPIEDVYVTGILTRIAGLSPFHTRVFPLAGKRYKDDCNFVNGYVIAAHGIDSASMRRIWGKILDKSCIKQPVSITHKTTAILTLRSTST